jgi:hypothetical protein
LPKSITFQGMRKTAVWPKSSEKWEPSSRALHFSRSGYAPAQYKYRYKTP